MDKICYDKTMDERGVKVAVLLDLGPAMGGVSIAEQLRKIVLEAGIVAMTVIDSEKDLINAFSGDPSLHLSKPLNYEKLAIDFNAIHHDSYRDMDNDPIWQLNLAQQNLTLPNGQIVPLSFSEIEIIKLLVSEGSNLVSRDRLILALGRNPEAYDQRALEVWMSRLRAKFGKNYNVIRSARNRGYRFVGTVMIIKTISKTLSVSKSHSSVAQGMLGIVR